MSVDIELSKLHNDLAELYRGGSVDRLQIARLWFRIDQLEDAARIIDNTPY